MRLRTWIIFGAGYVWGAWNGRDRLTELADRARDLLDSDLVRDYVERAQSGDEDETEDLDEEPEEEPEEPARSRSQARRRTPSRTGRSRR